MHTDSFWGHTGNLWMKERETEHRDSPLGDRRRSIRRRRRFYADWHRLDASCSVADGTGLVQAGAELTIQMVHTDWPTLRAAAAYADTDSTQSGMHGTNVWKLGGFVADGKNRTGLVQDGWFKQTGRRCSAAAADAGADSMQSDSGTVSASLEALVLICSQ